MLQEHLNCKG